MKTNRLKRVKRGLYYAVPPNEPKYVPVRNIIAYYAAPKGFLGYLEALRCYGIIYLPCAFYVSTCVLRQDYFNPFEFNHVQYCLFTVSDVKTDIQEVTYGNTGVRLRASSPERTFVDCIDRPRRARGWEAFFKSFVGLKNLNLEKVISILEQRDNQMLIRKTGLVLELLGYESFYLTPKIVLPYLKKIAKLVKGPMQYLDRRTMKYPDRIRVDPWRLYITELFEAQLREYPFDSIFE